MRELHVHHPEFYPECHKGGMAESPFCLLPTLIHTYYCLWREHKTFINSTYVSRLQTPRLNQCCCFIQWGQIIFFRATLSEACWHTSIIPVSGKLSKRTAINLRPVAYGHLSGTSHKLNVQATGICLFLRFPVRVKEG